MDKRYEAKKPNNKNRVDLETRLLIEVGEIPNRRAKHEQWEMAVTLVRWNGMQDQITQREKVKPDTMKFPSKQTWRLAVTYINNIEKLA